MHVGLLLNGYVQGARHPNPYSLHRLLCALAGVDVCLYRDKVKQNEADPQMCVAAWTRILLILLINCASWVLADIITESCCSIQKGDRNSGCGLSVQLFALSFVQITICPCSSTVGSWWNQRGVILEADEVSWVLVTAKHDEGDGLILRDWHSLRLLAHLSYLH
jgi:hypothetical protein